MKILFFIHSLSCGGAERVTATLANYWAREGWDVGIVTLAPETQDFYKLHSSVRRVALDLAQESTHLLHGVANNMRRVAALRKILKIERPDVVVGMMTTASVLLGLAGLGINRTVYIGSERIHPPMFPLGFFWERLRQSVYARLDAVVTLTKESAQWVAEHTGARCVEAIPNPLVWPCPAHPPRLDPQDYIDPGQRLLLGVGRLVEQKGFDLLIAAFDKLAHRFTQWLLVILGEGPLRRKLEGQVKAHGLQKRVLLPGVAGNIGDWYERADIYVMSSRFEGFGNTLLEALAYGVPAVSFDCPTGPSDIIRQGVDGFLVPPGDVENLARTLERLMGDQALRRRLGEQAVDVRERFSPDRIAEMWENLFARLIREKRGERWTNGDRETSSGTTRWGGADQTGVFQDTPL